MFVRVTLDDVLAIEPAELARVAADNSAFLLNKLTLSHVGKVVPRVGLVVALRSLVAVGVPEVPALQRGTVYVRLRFDAVVFRPFEREIVQGLVSAATEDGLTVTLGFFRSIVIFADWLQQGEATFDADAQRWLFEIDGAPYTLGAGMVVRLRTRELIFGTDATTTTKPHTGGSGGAGAGAGGVGGAPMSGAFKQSGGEVHERPLHGAPSSSAAASSASSAAFTEVMRSPMVVLGEIAPVTDPGTGGADWWRGGDGDDGGVDSDALSSSGSSLSSSVSSDMSEV